MTNGLKIYQSNNEWYVKDTMDQLTKFDSLEDALAHCEDSTIGLTVDVDERIILKPARGFF
jgi:hypothetical protein